MSKGIYTPFHAEELKYYDCGMCPRKGRTTLHTVQHDYFVSVNPLLS